MACLQSAYRHLQRNGAFDEVRFVVKRMKAHSRVCDLRKWIYCRCIMLYVDRLTSCSENQVSSCICCCMLCHIALHHIALILHHSSNAAKHKLWCILSASHACVSSNVPAKPLVQIVAKHVYVLARLALRHECSFSALTLIRQPTLTSNAWRRSECSASCDAYCNAMCRSGEAGRGQTSLG